MEGVGGERRERGIRCIMGDVQEANKRLPSSGKLFEMRVTLNWKASMKFR